MKILVINGPNLNFLGIREPGIYGKQDYNYLLKTIADKAEAEGHNIEVFQSNHEGAIIDRIQDAYSDGTEAIIINGFKVSWKSMSLDHIITSWSCDRYLSEILSIIYI